MNILDDYTTWLRSKKYTPSTIDASIRVLRRLNRENPKPTRSDEFLLRRYLRYVKETRRNPLGKRFTSVLEKQGLDPTSERAMSGTRKRELLMMGQFHDLKDRCLNSTDKTAMLVGFYMVSGKKPREFLQQKHSASSFSDHFPRTGTFLYENLSPSITWAYRMLLAAAKREAAALDIDADLDILYRSRLALL